MGKPLLSICIATMNRALPLRETLKSIFSQSPSEVDVVIVDGSSTEDTEEVVSRFPEHTSRIHYVRKKRPEGVDRDFDTAVGHARGEYCWLLADDDPLKPGALGRVMEALRRFPSVVVVNAEVRNPDLSLLLEERRLRIHVDRTYSPAQFREFFIETAGYLSFVGGVVIQKKLWCSRERGLYYGTEFLHVGVLFQAPLPGEAFVIAEPLISIRYGVAKWTARGFDIWMFKWPGLIWSFPGFSDSDKVLVTPREPWRALKTLLTFRATGAYSLREYRTIISCRPGQGWKRLIPWVVAILPGIVVNTLGILYFSLFHRHALMPLVDLSNSRFCVMNLLRKGVR